MPPAGRVLQILHLLEPAGALAAAAHLVTPVGVAVGLQVKVAGDVVTWRGRQAHAGGCWAQQVQSVHSLVSAAALPGDRFLPLDAAPSSWLKMVRSGAWIHLGGAVELFGAQHVTFSPNVPASTAQLVARMIAEGGTLSAGTLHEGGRTVKVRADAGAAHVYLA